MDIRIQPEKEIYEQGKLIRGDIVISDVDYQLNGDQIKLGLYEYVEGTGAGAGLWRRKDWYESMGDFVIPMAANYPIPFELQLPINCRLSRKSDPGTHNAQGWQLKVWVKTSKFKEKSEKHYIWVKPAREFEAIYETCERFLNFKPWGKAGQLTWGNETYFLMKSSDSSDSRVTDINIWLRQEETSDNISARVYIGLKPKFAKSWRERIMAKLRVGPTDNRSLNMTQSQIFLPNGDVNHTEIAKVINGIIEEVVASRS